jgi:Icc-related predicted phosphoesterase
MKKNYLFQIFFAVFLFSVQWSFSGEIKITHGPYLQNLGENETTIMWLTNKNAVSWVELAPDNGLTFYNKEHPKIFASKIGIKTEGKIHTVTIRHLKPGAKYRYRIYSQEVLKHEGNRVYYGDIVATEVYGVKPLSFVTNNSGKAAITFSMLNDIHGHNDVLEKLLAKAEPMKNDLIIFNGDMVSSINNEEQLFSDFMDKSVELFAKEIPMYYARGNHETRGNLASSFQNYFTPLTPTLYYTFRQGPVCFIVLDSGEDKPDSDKEYRGIVDYDSYRTEEAQWLSKVVESADFQNAPFKVVICHIPPDNDWHGNVEVLKKFVPVLNQAKIDIMLCGHEHRHFKREANEQVQFPVLVNSNRAVVKGNATAQELSLEVISVDGEKVDAITLKK